MRHQDPRRCPPSRPWRVLTGTLLTGLFLMGSFKEKDAGNDFAAELWKGAAIFVGGATLIDALYGASNSARRLGQRLFSQASLQAGEGYSPLPNPNPNHD